MATFTTEELDAKENRTYTTAELDILENQSLVEDKILSGEAEIAEFAPIPIRGILDTDKDLSAHLTSGLYYTKRFGVPLDQSFDLVEQLGALHYGEEMPAATLWSRVKRSYQGGKAQTQAGDLAKTAWWQMIRDPEAYEKSREQIDKLMSKISPDYWQEERSFIERMFQESADVTPFALKAVKQGAAGAVIGGAISTALGAGPIPGIKWGGALGAAERVAELETGLELIALMQMKDEYGNRIDPKIAWAVAGGVGLLNGAIEVGQIATLASTLGISTKIFENAAQKATARLFAEGTLRQIAAKYVAQFGYTLSAETAQELVQEGVAITGDYLAVEINNLTKGTDIKPATGEEIIARLLETAEKSAMAFAPMVGGGMGIGGLTRAIIGKEAEKATEDEGLRTAGEMKAEYAPKEPIPPISELAAEINKASERIRAEKGTFTTEELQTIAEKALAEIPKAEEEEHQAGVNRLAQLGQKATGVAQEGQTTLEPTGTTPQGEVVSPAPLTEAKQPAAEKVVERPQSPKGLKKPISELSDKELAEREAKASPYHRHYVQEIAWRKQQAKQAPPGGVAPAPEGKVDTRPFQKGDIVETSEHGVPYKARVVSVQSDGTVIINAREFQGQTAGARIKKSPDALTLVNKAAPSELPRTVSVNNKIYHLMADGKTYSAGKGKAKFSYDQLQQEGQVLSVSISTGAQAKQATVDTGRLKGGRQAGGTILFSPEEWKALLGSVSYHIKRGAKTLEEVTTRIVAEVGEWIRPYVQQAWDEINKTLAAPPEKVVAQKPEKAVKKEPRTKKTARARRIEKRLSEDYGEAAAYEGMSMADQAARADNLVTEDPERVWRILRGQEEPPAGLRKLSLYSAMETQAIETNDVVAQRELAVGRAAQAATEFGQEVKALDRPELRIGENPIRATQDVAKAREKAYTQRTGEKSTKAKKAEAKEIKKQIRAEAKISKWEAFIRSLEC